jgi:hypothetical protein
LGTEYAQSEGRAGRAFGSADGGFSFAAFDTGSAAQGKSILGPGRFAASRRTQRIAAGVCMLGFEVFPRLLRFSATKRLRAGVRLVVS